MAPKIPIVAGQTEALLTDFAYTAGTKVSIKVTTTDGTFMTITGTGGSSSNPSSSPTPTPTYSNAYSYSNAHCDSNCLLLLQRPL